MNIPDPQHCSLDLNKRRAAYVPDGLEEEARLLDVVDVSAVRGNHGLEVRQISLGVHHRLPGHAATE